MQILNISAVTQPSESLTTEPYPPNGNLINVRVAYQSVEMVMEDAESEPMSPVNEEIMLQYRGIIMQLI